MGQEWQVRPSGATVKIKTAPRSKCRLCKEVGKLWETRTKNTGSGRKKGAEKCARRKMTPCGQPKGSALAGLEAGVFLVNHVDASLAAHYTAFLVAFFGRFEGINDFHRSGFHLSRH